MHRPLVQQIRFRAAPGLVWWHTPNGEKRSRASAAILVGLGVQPGMPDLLFYRAGKLYGIECKASGKIAGKSRCGRVSSSQRSIMASLVAQGADIVVIDNVDAGIRWLEERGLLRGRMQ